VPYNGTSTTGGDSSTSIYYIRISMPTPRAVNAAVTQSRTSG
jgi:hypothetical protein